MIIEKEEIMGRLTKRPIQIYLNEKQDQALRRIASEKDMTLSELIRRGVNLLLEQIPGEQDPAYPMIGLDSSGAADLGQRHDEYLAEEIEKESRE